MHCSERGYQIIAGTAAEVAVMAAARLYQWLLVFPSLITMRTIVLGLACVAVAAAFLPLPGNTQVACYQQVRPQMPMQQSYGYSTDARTCPTMV